MEDTFKPLDNTARISLPHYVGIIRAVKATQGHIRVNINGPRPYYHDETYYQSPYLWRVLGTSPLSQTITNATRLKFSIDEAETEQFIVTVIGTDDRASTSKDVITFAPGEMEKFTTRNFTSCSSIVKDVFTKSDVKIAGMNNEDFGIIPNAAFEARNTIIQITDKCLQCCTNCRCFDILFKLPTPYLYYDEQVVEYPEVLMAKTMEWISMPKDGQEQKTLMYAEKAKAVLSAYNNNDSGVEKRVDLGANRFCTYTGSGWSKI
jgi:hypothetical protein